METANLYSYIQVARIYCLSHFEMVVENLCNFRIVMFRFSILNGLSLRCYDVNRAIYLQNCWNNWGFPSVFIKIHYLRGASNKVNCFRLKKKRNLSNIVNFEVQALFFFNISTFLPVSAVCLVGFRYFQNGYTATYK